MTAAATMVRRRGACPGLSSPMPTGDGFLVRLRPIGTIPLGAFADMCGAARCHGNGIIEVTARGSIQVRGLSAASAPRFADAVAGLDIAAVDGIPVLSNALAGLDADEILDAGVLAGDLRRGLTRTSLATRLAGKVSIVVDGGGGLGLDAIAADVRMRTEVIGGIAMVRLGIGGDGASAADLGTIAPTDVVDAAMRLLAVIAQDGRDARARDVLASKGAAPFRAAITDLLQPPERHDINRRWRGSERRTDPIGLYRLRNGSFACGIGLAFGHTDAATLERLIERAKAAKADGMRAGPGRALMIVGLSHDACSAFDADAERLGFIVRADDPRRRVVACAGAPICASAYIAARAVAPLIAETAALSPSDSFKIHISGCAKGCAHPAPATLVVVGTPTGCAFVADGTVRDAPFAAAATGDLPAVIARYLRDQRRAADEVHHV